jgi:hypothetical protein
MEILFVFLKWVASFAHMDAETGSKMDLGNLATVICPSILYARGSNAMRDETFGSLRVVTALLENQDDYFTVPEEFLSILQDQEYFANSLELPGKEFMKKCDTYMRLKGSNGRLPPGTPLNGPTSVRYPLQGSPGVERSGMIGPSYSERNIRPPTAQNHSYQSVPPPPPASAPMPQSAQYISRSQQGDEWPGPRPSALSASRPSSYIGPPRPNVDSSTAINPNIPNTNGYPSAARQRT